MDDIVNAICRALREFGFPVFVAVYLLCRIENRLDCLHNAIDNLRKDLFKD